MGAAADSSLAQVSLEGLSSVARRRRSANGSATQAADDGACEGIAGRSTNQRTTTGADSTAGQRALPWGVSAGGGRQRQCGADRKICDSRHEQLLVPIPRYNEEEHVHRQKSGVQTVTVPGNFASASRQVSPHVIGTAFPRGDRFKCPGCHRAVAWRIHGPAWRPTYGEAATSTGAGRPR
jgi:hypothetical protein